MYTAYVADTPNGRKLLIALEELELDYRVHYVDLGAGEQFDPAFERLSPNNKIPVLVDQDSGASVFESGAILYHLAATTGRLMPADGQGRDRVLQWLFLQAASVGPMLGQLWWFRHRAGAGNEVALERYKAETERLYRLIERRLGESAHIADEDYTVADISFHPWLASHEELGIDIGAYPRVQAWLAAVAARPALARAALRMRER